MLDLVLLLHSCSKAPTRRWFVRISTLTESSYKRYRAVHAWLRLNHFLFREARGNKAGKFSTRRRDAGSLSSTTDTTYNERISSVLLYGATNSVEFERECKHEDRSREVDAAVETRRFDSTKTWNDGPI